MRSSRAAAGHPAPFALPIPKRSDIAVWAAAWLRGLSQITFSPRPSDGLLVLAAAAVLSPGSAVGGALGAAAGTLAGWRGGYATHAEWREGLCGYNPAITGFIWGAVVARADHGLLVFAAALGVAILIDAVLRPRFRQRTLPPLALAAVLTSWIGAWGLYWAGDSLWWPYPGLLPLGELGVGAAIVLVAAVLARTAPTAAGLAAVLAALFAFGPAALWASDVTPSGLWAFTAVPASFGVAGVFFAAGATGLAVGAAAGLAGGALWMAWVLSGLGGWLPPLLFPAQIAIWGAILAVRRFGGPLVLDPRIWRVAAALRAARRSGRPAVALAGAGISTGSGIPDYVSGAWLDRSVPAGEYGFDRFLASDRARRAYWRACSRFRAVAADREPNAAHRALARMESRGWLAGVVTQNVDGYHQGAGQRTLVELHGNIHRVWCLQCGRLAPWPAPRDWAETAPSCGHCGGLLKPAVIALGEDIPPPVWRAAMDLMRECGVLLVVGSQVAISSAATLVAEARESGAHVVFLNLGPLHAPVLADDLVVPLPLEASLPGLELLLRWDVVKRAPA